jgi:hypothetical protein
LRRKPVGEGRGERGLRRLGLEGERWREERRREETRRREAMVGKRESRERERLLGFFFV